MFGADVPGTELQRFSECQLQHFLRPWRKWGRTFSYGAAGWGNSLLDTLPRLGQGHAYLREHLPSDPIVDLSEAEEHVLRPDEGMLK